MEQDTSEAAFPVIGVGVGAEGLLALQTLLAHIPAGSGMAFVVIVHSAPGPALAAALQPHTSLPVIDAQEPLALVPGQILLLPPDRLPVLRDGVLYPLPDQTSAGQRAPVDRLFGALAEHYAVRVAALVLAGAGSDGALGLRRIKAAGGLTLAQEPSEAEAAAMPRAAIATGMVDLVRPVAELPGALDDYWRSTRRFGLPVEAPRDDPGDGAPGGILVGQQRPAPIDIDPPLYQRHGLSPALPPIGVSDGRPAASQPVPEEIRSLDALSKKLLAEHGPPCVIVNERFEILHLGQGSSRFLQLRSGDPSYNLLLLIHPGLRLGLRPALFNALQHSVRSEASNLPIELEGVTRLVSIVVQPVSRPAWARGMLLVLFYDQGLALPSVSLPAGQADALVRHAEADLQRTRLLLQVQVEQYETMVEEYKAVNQELQALNEELQTSKEQLLTLNEELLTVNGELRYKVGELAQANNDLQNLMAATAIPTLFVDRRLHVTRYTPAALELFNLIAADLHRPLAHITHGLHYPNLLADARLVLLNAEPVEREVRDNANRFYLVRLHPYRTSASDADGVVLSFVEISARKRAEAALRESEARFRLLVEGAHDYAMFLLDPGNQITFWSSGAERVFGWSEAEARGQSGALIFTPEDRARGEVEREVQTALREGRAPDQRWHIRKDGSRLFVDGALIRLDGQNGVLRGFVKIGRDATVQHEAEEALRQARDELERRVAERTADLAATNRALEQEIAERRQLEAERAALLQRLIAAQEDERGRIARELHDSLGQFLTALSVRLGALQGQADGQPALSAGLAELRRMAGRIDTELDRLTVELRPPTLDDIGLVDALTSYTSEWTATSSVPVDIITVRFDSARLPPAVEAAVFRIVQEALTNVLKHAQASRVSVILERRPGALRVIIEDDGQGFRVEATTPEPTSGRRLGLLGMRERATLAGGALTIESALGEGTSIYLSIPLEARG
ncbi:MAG: hypothetical protein OHK0022_58310 [Roseiflexaceae bacterium]